MKALLLAGGFGTRLRPLTLTRPKHLLPIANRPHIDHVFDLLLHHGVDEVILTTSYLAQAFEGTVAAAREQGLEVHVTFEEVALGTAGALKNAESEVGDEAFFVFNGDILCDVDLGALLAFHRAKEAKGTILLTPVEDPSAFGVVPTDGTGRVTGFIEKPPAAEAPTNLINAGVYILEPEVLDRIPAGREWSAERALFPQLVADGAPLYATSMDFYWMDVGTPDKYLQANLDAIEGRFAMESGVAVDPSAKIDDGARVARSCIGPGCVVEAGATVERSVLLPGVQVGAEAVLEGSIVGENGTVARGAAVTGATAGDGERIG